MATRNSWNNSVSAANVSFTGGTFGAGTDATDNSISIGTSASAGRTISIGNGTGTSSVAIDCGTGGITVGSTSTAHASTFGSSNSTSASTLQSGSGALNVTSTNGSLTVNSGTGQLAISNDSSATTVNIATGSAVKTVTLGSTTGASVTNLQAGSAGIKIPAFAEGALVTSSTGVISTVTGTAGYVLTANASGTAPSFQAAAGGFTWTVITADQTAAVNNGYICNKASALLLALPTTAATGSILEVTGINTALGWKITQASGQQIHFGTVNTTSGATGYLQSSAVRDSVRMVCVVANNEWNVLSCQGSPTYV
jgi:hypothetical protein